MTSTWRSSGWPYPTETVGGSQAKNRSVGGDVPAWRPRQSASSMAMFVAPSVGSVTRRRQAFAAIAAMVPRVSSALRTPPQIRLARGARLIQAPHRRADGRRRRDRGVLLRLARDLDHRVAELVERLLGLRLGGLDHQRLFDDEREIRRGRIEAEIQQPLGDVR